jgi:poly-gamma-glutamate synthesis protein (capsule biosynthesis protein)
MTRQSPENAACHILDWGQAGLFDTLETLERLRIESAGAGLDIDQASSS